MFSNDEIDDTDLEICELLDPTRIAELDLSRNAETESDLSRRPERKRNIVKRQISFSKKAIYRYVPLGSQDPNKNFILGASGSFASANQDPFKLLVSHGPRKQIEVDLNRLMAITSDRFSCQFRSVIDNFIQTWKNICDLQPILDETISAFRILSPQSSIQISQKASKDTNEEKPSTDDNVQNEELKEESPKIPLQIEINKASSSQTFQRADVPEQTLSSDTVKNILDLPRKKWREDLSEIENLITAKSLNQIILSSLGTRHSSRKVEKGQCSSSSSTSSSLPEVQAQSSTSTKVKAHRQKNVKVASEPPKEKIQVREILICSMFGQILSDELDKLDKQTSQAEPRFQSIVDSLSILPYPGDLASSGATIKAIEYNLNHRILLFQKEVPKLQRNVINFFNRIECLVRKWPLSTGTRTLKQYLAFVLDMESKVVKFNFLALALKFKIEFERLRILSDRSRNKRENLDYSLVLYKKYYMAVKYINVLEEIRGLSEKFYSYIVKPLPSFLV